MAERMTIQLYQPVQAHAALAQSWQDYIKPMLMAGNRLELEVKPQKRSLKENAMLHAMLTYISKHLEWAGKKRDVETWKRLMVASWRRARNEHVEILPALDGHGVDIVFRRTSELTRSECAELIEFIFAWGSMQGFHIPDKSQIEYRNQDVDPDTGEIYQ
jgi:hypothetical protein